MLGDKFMYKIIALDMDETLLQPNKTISPVDRDALIKAQKMGIYVVLATGRPIFGIKKYIDELQIPDKGYAICFNGAEVTTIDTKELIYNKKLNGDDLHYLADLSDKLKVNMHGFDKNGCFSERMSKYTNLEITLNHIDLNYVKYSDFSKDHEIIKLMYVDEPDYLDSVIEEFPSEIYERFNIVKSAPFFLEFLNPKADKWYALEALAKHLGIKNEEIITFGDEKNDHMMVKNAGLGIAMGNAIEILKKDAKFVTLKNTENGIAYALNKFVFNEK